MERPDKRSKNSALIKGNKTYEKINKIGIPTIRPKHISNPQMIIGFCSGAKWGFLSEIVK